MGSNEVQLLVVTVDFSGTLLEYFFYGPLFTFTSSLYTNMCTFYSLHWENTLVAAVFKSV